MSIQKYFSKKMVVSFFCLMSVVSFVKSSSNEQLIKQLEDAIKALEVQKKQLIDTLTSLSSPSLAKKTFVNLPKTILKHCMYIVGGIVVGTGVLLVINNQGLENIRNAIVSNPNDFLHNVRVQQAKDSITSPEFIGKTLLSFMGSYLAFLIVFDYVFSAKKNIEEQKTVLRDLVMLLEQHESKLKELKNLYR